MKEDKKYRLVPTQVHTRKIDRLVAKHQMAKRYTQFCKSAKDKYGRPTHNRIHSKKGTNPIVSLIRERQSYFAAQWRHYVPV